MGCQEFWFWDVGFICFFVLDPFACILVIWGFLGLKVGFHLFLISLFFSVLFELQFVWFARPSPECNFYSNLMFFSLFLDVQSSEMCIYLILEEGFFNSDFFVRVYILSCLFRFSTTFFFFLFSSFYFLFPFHCNMYGWEPFPWHPYLCISLIIYVCIYK